MSEDYSILIDALKGAKKVGVLTGAGVSTLSGIPDFRGPQGLYKNPDAERIFDSKTLSSRALDKLNCHSRP